MMFVKAMIGPFIGVSLSMLVSAAIQAHLGYKDNIQLFILAAIALAVLALCLIVVTKGEK